MQKAKLHLLPVQLGEGHSKDVIPEGVLQVARRLRYFIVEDARSARRFLKSIGTQIPIDDMDIQVLDKRSQAEDIPELCKKLVQGEEVGLLSEAGLPCIADPGAKAVAFCHRQSIEVVVYSGPSSIILALIGSGFNGQEFVFHGYLPIDKSERVACIKRMERDALASGYSQIFMETPFRNEKLFAQLLQSCAPSTMLSIGCNLTLQNALTRTLSIKEWRGMKRNFQKQPCVFVIGTYTR